MSADELGAVWSSGPVRISRSIKEVGMDADHEKDAQEHAQEPPERQEDKVELSSDAETGEPQKITVNQHPNSHAEVEIAGRNIDVTVG